MNAREDIQYDSDPQTSQQVEFDAAAIKEIQNSVVTLLLQPSKEQRLT